jgi:UDP-N-acetylglucosamine 2-epimerase
MEKSVVLKYKALSEKYPHVIFYEGDNNLPLLKRADVMVCDSSSIIVEFLMLDKPVVTFRNTNPGDYLIDIERAELLEESIERALKPTPELLGSIRQHTDRINPYRDGRSAERVLEAVERFRMHHQGLLRSKPWNLIRKIKMRLKAKYYRW